MYNAVKKLLILAVCVAVIISIVGCQSTNDRSVEVLVAGDGGFPAALAGKWKADKQGWEFVFEPNGRISSAVISMGRVEMTPGKTARYPTRFGGKGIVEPGLWSVQYNPDERDLAVTVVIEHFYQDLWPPQAMEGYFTDMMAGPVSQDYDLWEADWFGFGKLTAYLPEPNEFYNTTEPEFRGHLVFEKVKETGD